MKAKVFTVFAVLAAFVVLTLSGCATYGAKGVMPSMSDPSVDKTKLSTKMGDGIAVTAYPLTTAEESKKYFDEDLVGKGILPVFVEIQNDVEGVKLIAATLSAGNVVASVMTSQDVYGVIKRDWVARATFWMFPTYFVGAPISALATYATNKWWIQEDLEGGKLLSMGKLERGVTTGFLCFRVPEKDAGQKKVLKLIFQNNERLLEYNLEVK